MTRIELAEEMLVDAALCLANQRYRSAISRSYYACYHAARWCLEQIGINITSRDVHGACLRLFSLHFIRNGLLPDWMGELLNRLRRMRIAADYRLQLPNEEAGAICGAK
ncbi:HEPN domain-containing protein [Candidatus Poribacteria bacterium]|nr:HEPN domain-containing protein [Candidatus Poribacteria bacterium]